MRQPSSALPSSRLVEVLRVMRYLAVCTTCGHRVPKGDVFKSGPRPCVNCRTILVPTEPWNQIGNIVCGLLLVALLSVLIGGFVLGSYVVIAIGIVGISTEL